MSVESDLIKVKKDLAEFQNQKIKIEARMKGLEEEKETLLKECAELGVDPSQLAAEVKKVEDSLAADIKQVQQTLEVFNVTKSA